MDAGGRDWCGGDGKAGGSGAFNAPEGDARVTREGVKGSARAGTESELQREQRQETPRGSAPHLAGAEGP